MKLKQLIISASCLFIITTINAQRKKKETSFKTEMISHYQEYYQLMVKNGNVKGAIESLNHLQILSPSAEKKDTLGALYLENKELLLAIKTVGESNTDLAIRIKANAFKALQNTKKAIENYELLIARNQNILDVYELSQLQFGLQRFAEAKKSIQYGLQNAKDEKVRIFIKKDNYIETPLKAAFLNILALIEYNIDKNNIQKVIALFDEALKVDPNFILATENKKNIIENAQKK